MPDFQHVASPVFSPTRCVACSANNCETGFIDLLVDAEAVNGYDEKNGAPIIHDGEQNFGHLYLCGDCCGYAASKLGWTSPAGAMSLKTQIQTMSVEIEQLNAELTAERSPDSKVVKVADLGQYLREATAAKSASTATLTEGRP